MSLEGWATKESGGTKRKALRRLERLPTSETGRGAAVPFPHAERLWRAVTTEAERKKLIEDAPIEDVELDKLHATQHSVVRSNVERYIKDPGAKPSAMGPSNRHARHGGKVDFPIVFVVDGQWLIYDGHHRLTAHKLQGDEFARARVVRLSEAA